MSRFLRETWENQGHRTAHPYTDYKRAALVLRALDIATRNATKVNFQHWKRDDIVDEVPEYPAMPEPKAPDQALQQAGVLSQINRPKPRYPSDYGITVEQALAAGVGPELIQPPRDLAEANAAVARYIEEWMKSTPPTEPPSRMPVAHHEACG